MNGIAEILGIRFCDMSSDDARKKICRAMDRRERLKIFTPNPDILLRAQDSPALFSALSSGALLLPDGIGVILASRLLRTPLRERITGIDTGEFILAEAAKRDFGVFLLGAEDGIAENAAKRLTEKYPRLRICGTHHGFFEKNGEENKRVLGNIQKASPDILLVCFGCPAQELWICENADKLPSVSIFAGLGGSLDVWSGSIRRAPRILQKFGMEWLWRAIREPKRLKKLALIPVFLEKVLRQRLTLGRQNKKKQGKSL